MAMIYLHEIVVGVQFIDFFTDERITITGVDTVGNMVSTSSEHPELGRVSKLNIQLYVRLGDWVLVKPTEGEH